MVSLFLRPRWGNLVVGITYHNKSWESFPQVVIIGPWCSEDLNFLPTSFESEEVLNQITQLQKLAIGLEAEAAIACMAEANLGFDNLIQSLEVGHFPLRRSTTSLKR